jgi:glutathione S-transferase
MSGAEIRRVWGIGTPRTLRPHWMLHELDLPYETRAVLPRSEGMNDPEFRRLSQRGKVPFFEDGEVRMGESGAIVFYLADRYRDRLVLAPEPVSPPRARFDDLCLFILTELDATLYIVRRHEGLADVYGASPTAAASAREYFIRQAVEMERSLADGRPYLMGDDFSAADLLLVSCLDWARFVGVSLSDALVAYREKIAQRAAYSRAMQANFPPAAMEALRNQRSE